MKRLTDIDKTRLTQLEPVQETLRVLIAAVCAIHPQTMPAIAKQLRDRTNNEHLGATARVMIWDLADGIDVLTGVKTDR